MAVKYNAAMIVKLVEEKKVPLMVRHGVIAVWEGTRRVLKTTKGGNVWRTRQRIKTASPVSKDKNGFVGAFNIISSAFEEYGYVRSLSENISLTGDGRMQNALHLREVDSRRRTMAFNRVYSKLFKEDIKTYKLTNP